MTYDKGVTVIVGKDSLKVLAIRVETPEFGTNWEDKVGDSAKAVLEKHRARYEEYQGPNSDGKNIGWFMIEDEALLIFDFDKSDGSRLNNEVKDDSKVESIELMYAKHFD